MCGLYDVAKAIYSGDIAAARKALEAMELTGRDKWDVFRACVVAGADARAKGTVPIDFGAQARLDALMAVEERKMFNHRPVRPAIAKKTKALA